MHNMRAYAVLVAVMLAVAAEARVLHGTAGSAATTTAASTVATKIEKAAATATPESAPKLADAVGAVAVAPLKEKAALPAAATLPSASAVKGVQERGGGDSDIGGGDSGIGGGRHGGGDSDFGGGGRGIGGGNHRGERDLDSTWDNDNFGARHNRNGERDLDSDWDSSSRSRSNHGHNHDDNLGEGHNHAGGGSGYYNRHCDPMFEDCSRYNRYNYDETRSVSSSGYNSYASSTVGPYAGSSDGYSYAGDGVAVASAGDAQAVAISGRRLMQRVMNFFQGL